MLYQLMSGCQALHRYCLSGARTVLYMAVTENITQHMACRVARVEMTLRRRTTPQRKASIQPRPTVKHEADSATFNDDLPYNMRPITPHFTMTYPTTCDRQHHIQP
jgi:hypothetical protein